MNRRRTASTALAAALAVLLLLAASSPAAARVTKLGPSLCETTGGGKIVSIPGFPGERIDRRLLNDIRYLRKRYKIFVTDGYSNDGVHAYNGEHPMGLALDIVPDTRRGGTWSDITRLAKMAEPRQNQPVAPFRWVGYDGDRGHGRGHHLHLSWNHSETKPGTIARTVYTMRCPGKGGKGGHGGGGNGNDKPDRPGKPQDEGSGGSAGTSGGIGGAVDTKRGKKKGERQNGKKSGKRGKGKRGKKEQGGRTSGGVMAGAPTLRVASASGGIGTVFLRGKAARAFLDIEPAIETGGVGAP